MKLTNECEYTPKFCCFCEQEVFRPNLNHKSPTDIAVTVPVEDHFTYCCSQCCDEHYGLKEGEDFLWCDGCESVLTLLQSVIVSSSKIKCPNCRKLL